MLKLTKVVFAVLGLSMIASAFAEPVNVNTASADEIADRLTGIGPTQAAALVDYRTTHGPFQSLDELTKVKGIGVKTLVKNQDHILLQGDTAPLASKPPAKTATAPDAAPSAAVNINSASAQQLLALSGIGPAKAAAIVSYREAHGTFQAIDDLVKVKGIGPKTLAKNRDRIVIQ